MPPEPEPIPIELDDESERVRVLGASRPLSKSLKESDVPSELDPTVVEPEEEPEPISIEPDTESERVRVLGASRPLGRSLKLLDCEHPEKASAPASNEIATSLLFIGYLPI